MEYTHVFHTFEPVYDASSQVLILGSFPSVRSREEGFYYGHPRNRFWKVTAGICRESVPVTIPEKRDFLLRNHIAVWDVIAECEILGSSDSSIRKVRENDMSVILEKAAVREIFANGETAYRLFLKYCRKEDQPPVRRLPSTSPANAAWNLQRLLAAWGEAIFPEGAGR